MAILKYIERMRHIDSLLVTKGACSIIILAKKIHLSRSSTLQYLSDMKKLGFPISYSKKEKCYSYDVEGKMTINLFEKIKN